jgi:hypothetical protein
MSSRWGQKIFDPTAVALVERVASGAMAENDARYVLINLIASLLGNGWDDWRDSRDEFRNIPFIVEAFTLVTWGLRESGVASLADGPEADAGAGSGVQDL